MERPLVPMEDLELTIAGPQGIEVRLGCSSRAVSEVVSESDTEIRILAQTTLLTLGTCISSDCLVLDRPIEGRNIINEANGQPANISEESTNCPPGPPDPTTAEP